jgi:hypothetical protein
VRTDGSIACWGRQVRGLNAPILPTATPVPPPAEAPIPLPTAAPIPAPTATPLPPTPNSEV